MCVTDRLKNRIFWPALNRTIVIRSSLMVIHHSERLAFDFPRRIMKIQLQYSFIKRIYRFTYSSLSTVVLLHTRICSWQCTQTGHNDTMIKIIQWRYNFFMLCKVAWLIYFATQLRESYKIPWSVMHDAHYNYQS